MCMHHNLFIRDSHERIGGWFVIPENLCILGEIQSHLMVCTAQ